MTECNIFSLLDNFFGSEKQPLGKALSIRQIRELREHVITFYQDYTVPLMAQNTTGVYLGGFLSSPPFTLQMPPYLSSALLATDAVFLFDPLHYWFCDEQYQRTRLESASTGWIDVDPRSNGYTKPDYAKTRRFLTCTLPQLYNLRPLVDTGGIVLVPADQFVAPNLGHVQQMAIQIFQLNEPVEALAELFSPADITVDDNRKGLFTFAGGNQVEQIRKSLVRGFEQFARDVVISNAIGALYTAPFRWEQHLCQTSVKQQTPTHVNVFEGVRHLRLPILANLSPDTISKIRCDSGFTTFRVGLQEALGYINAEIGSEDFRLRVAQVEEQVLLPKVEAIHQEVKTSQFQQATHALFEGVLMFIQVFAGAAVSNCSIENNLRASGIAGFVASGLSYLKDGVNRRGATSDARIWLQLVPENPASRLYGSPLTLRETPGEIDGWKIPPHPSLRVTVSEGLIKAPLDQSAE